MPWWMILLIVIGMIILILFPTCMFALFVRCGQIDRMLEEQEYREKHNIAN